jgi:hypothetical protein
MEVKPLGKILSDIKKEYDKSKKKDGKLLVGKDSKGRHNLFISQNRKLWQMKIEYLTPYTITGVGVEVGNVDRKMQTQLSKGTPLLFGLIAPQSDKKAIIAQGIASASSHSVENLKHLISSKQKRLDQKLDASLRKLLADEPFTRSYI